MESLVEDFLPDSDGDNFETEDESSGDERSNEVNSDTEESRPDFGLDMRAASGLLRDLYPFAFRLDAFDATMAQDWFALYDLVSRCSAQEVHVRGHLDRIAWKHGTPAWLIKIATRRAGAHYRLARGQSRRRTPGAFRSDCSRLCSTWSQG